MNLLKNLLFITFLVLPSFSVAQTTAIDEFIEEMVTQHGFERAYVANLLKQAKVKKSILKVMNRSSGTGKGIPWYRYQANFLTELRIEQGAAFWREHATALQRAEQEYGVPAEIILGIMGVETSFGRNMGTFRVIDALYTLAFSYPRRAEFFRNELKEFLLLSREQNYYPLTPLGSYAGAMGLGQFMPSSYRDYVVDFNHDGHRDIWNPDDAIGSIANYLKNYTEGGAGWQADKPVLQAVTVRPEAVGNLLNLKFNLSYSIKQLKDMGLQLATDRYDAEPAIFVELETEQGIFHWAGLNNFYMITRYNHSNRYAMAVYQLAKRIKNRYETE
jgi:membrane-bound lytic murein transglycosylase B